jgi:hypothetical protein
VRRTRKSVGFPGRAASAVDLPPDRAFVLQLDSRARPRRLAGRAEHIASGRVEYFGSLAELVAFLTNVLTNDPQRE